MLIAVTRKVSTKLASCELEYSPRVDIDAAQASAQHRGYELALESLGAHIVSLPALPDQPDCVFVEDPMLVLDEIAVVTRMGAVARRGESQSLAREISRFRILAGIEDPGTLEGGDVVRIGRTLFVGLSRRTNQEGIRQLAAICEPLGYRVVPVPVTRCLHLKSACCAVSDDTVLMNRSWFDASAFEKFRVLDVAADEPGAADVLPLGGAVLIPASFPRTQELLESAGFRAHAVDVAELQKAEAGVTCMSLIFEAS